MLKLENKTLKVEAEKMIGRFIGPLNNSSEHQKWQVEKSRQGLSHD